MYFIARGDCEVSVKNEDKYCIIVRQLETGAHFGEIALLNSI